MKLPASPLLPLLAALCAGTFPAGVDGTKSTITKTEDIVTWWATLGQTERSKLSDLFYPSWFDALDETEQAAYAHVAQTLYEFVDSGADSHPHDGYIGFSPLLLRASFHGAGSLHVPSGTGGTNGGTIFSEGELADGGNACIGIATSRLESLLDTDLISKADALVIAGSVALDDMQFPRMDLLRITGGRNDVTGVALRDRLPNPDFNPTELFTNAYGLTLSELTALIGGAHNFGSAHGVCTGYVGQWTSDPLQWNAPGGESPEFFPDLMREDWRWYEVCTYQNGTSTYVSVDDPFANGGFPGGEEEEEEEEVEVSQCELEGNVVPFVCEEQAMRGCDFEDGSYDADESPCDISLLQFRLKSDFFLKADPELRPFAQKFADDADALAEQFGIAYHKLTHAGLDRCGLSGSLDGCGDMSICVGIHDETTGEYLTSRCEADETKIAEASVEDDDSWSLDRSSSIFVLSALGVCLIIIGLLGSKLSSAESSSMTTTSSSSKDVSSVTKKASEEGSSSDESQGSGSNENAEDDVVLSA